MIQTVAAFTDDLRRRGYPVAGRAGRMVFIADVQRAVAERYGLAIADLKSSRRDYPIAHPRQVAMLLARNLTGRSLSEIGRRMGDRDHSTIITGCRSVTKRRLEDSELDKVICELTVQLSAR